MSGPRKADVPEEPVVPPGDPVIVPEPVVEVGKPSPTEQKPGLVIERFEPAMIVADRALYLDAGGRLVEEGDPAVRILLCGMGGQLHVNDLARLSLKVVRGKIVQTAERPAPVED